MAFQETRFTFDGWADKAVTTAAITRDCKLACAGSHDEVVIFSPEADKPLWKDQHGEHNTIVAVSMSSDGSFLAVATGEKDMSLKAIADEDRSLLATRAVTQRASKATTASSKADGKEIKESLEEAVAPPPTMTDSGEGFDMVFHVQLAHGSPTKQIRDFTNVKQLYDSINVEYGLDDDTQIAFCTLNTHKVTNVECIYTLPGLYS